MTDLTKKKERKKPKHYDVLNTFKPNAQDSKRSIPGPKKTL